MGGGPGLAGEGSDSEVSGRIGEMRSASNGGGELGGQWWGGRGGGGGRPFNGLGGPGTTTLEGCGPQDIGDDTKALGRRGLSGGDIRRSVVSTY